MYYVVETVSERVHARMKFACDVQQSPLYTDHIRSLIISEVLTDHKNKLILNHFQRITSQLTCMGVFLLVVTAMFL